MRGSLRRIVTGATVIVAAVAVIVTALAAFPLLNTVDEASARSALVTQVDRLVAATPEGRDAAIASASLLSDPDALIAVVGTDGSVRGPAADIVNGRVAQQVAAGTEASITVRRDHASFAVEARPLPGGGGVAAAQDLSRVKALGADVLGRIALALAMGFLAAVAAAVLLSRWLSRPLAGLARAARRIAGGDRTVELDDSRIDEVSDVEAALRSIGAALAHSEARQREFLLSVSHELRTPLTAIRGYSSALRDGLIPPEGVREVGETLDAEATRLATFTDDLLTLARLEADDFPIRLSSIPIAPLLSQTVAAWQGAAQSAGVEVRQDGAAASGVLVTTDPQRLRQVLDGLIENALRVSPSGTRIVLRADHGTEGTAVFEVADTGPGLTPDDAARAFERGFLRERYLDVRRVGSGLGLSIAARLTDRLGGRISARPGAEGGTVFRIEIGTDPS
ncbi:HAMP domain-containing sensor histidine kinase [Microbacterium testaceum]|uniref:HAMP domain-containing sensor histidine kinase n=1 Tax=Microbacterium testaceum TaxID=2033 RepID=UPI000734E902|nr:HAMP domain-containing sensor histidine kinase [Microbacterium testaceum]